MKRGNLTVIDATNVNPQDRKSLVKLAREYHFLPVAIVIDLPWKVCHERNQERPNRQFGKHVVMKHSGALRRGLRSLRKSEGFTNVHILKTVEDVDSVEIVRQPLWCNKKEEHGPFDIIGDVHGCFDELYELLQKLGYEVSEDGGRYSISHPDERKVIFVGDLVDRGPKTPEVIKIAMDIVEQEQGFCVVGKPLHKVHECVFGVLAMESEPVDPRL